MQSNLELAKTPYQRLLALAEIQDFLSQLTTSGTSVDIVLDEVARDGLGNLFYLLNEQTLEIAGMLEEKNPGGAGDE